MAITYTATSNPGGLTGTALDGLPIEVTGLTLDTPYTFTVTATADLASAASTPSASVTPVAYSSIAYTFGDNSDGRWGQNKITADVTLTALGTESKWIACSSGSSPNVILVKTNGTLWTSGFGTYGTTGLTDIIGRSSPTQVGALTNWSSKISIGAYQAFAIKKDGTLWTWGPGWDGVSGLGNVDQRNSPVQVGTQTNWKEVSGSDYGHSSYGYHFIMATKTDGTLWSWGHNGSGRLGHGDTIHRSSPTQVGTLTNWSKLSSKFRRCAHAIKTDGTLWSWGDNSFGLLGVGHTAQRDSPVQVGALTTWSKVASSHYVSFAIKTDGALWGWGSDFRGSLGVSSSYLATSSPIQVGTWTNWSSISPNQYNTFGTTTDGKLFAWGNNYAGLLYGDGSLGYRSSPVQVGTKTTWKTVVTAPQGEGVVALSTQ